jgi:Tfp pilus assembly protein PilF
MNRRTNQKCFINSLLTKESLLLLLLAVCTFLVYSRSIKGPFVFDDIDNIQANPHIHITEPTLNKMINAGFKGPSSHRPVANMSFALNYYFDRYNTEGYHFINIMIHISTGVILFYLIKVTLLILSAPDLKAGSEKNVLTEDRGEAVCNFTAQGISASLRSPSRASADIVFISFFSAFIWLVHPLQTQTVSYIVQRMNGMAAMFYILSLLLYIKARVEHDKWKKLLLFSGCMISGILSLGSKEIAATLPFFIFLYEWYFFQDVKLNWLKRNAVYLLCLSFVIGFLVLFFLGGHPIEKILSSYKYRDFTLHQRILTEFRVVIYYISLIIFPHPKRLNLLHDFTLSNSFIDPPTTLLSFIAILGAVAAAIWLARKERLLSFCILWFIGNLVIESSVINLEIIFEHRLYLPSMFIILIFVMLVFRFARSKQKGGVFLLAVAITFSVWTYQRNIVWSDDVLLWKDCVVKAPHKSRQHYNLGVVLARKGDLNKAIEEYRAALKIKPDYVDAYYNLGNAFIRKGDAGAAIHNYRMALQNNPDFYKAYYNIAKILYGQGKIDEAIENYQKALAINNETPQTLYNLSWIYATSENRRYRNGIKALKLAEKLCMLTRYQQPLALDALAAAYAENRNFDKAVETGQKALELALQVGPKELILGLKKRLKVYEIGRPFRQSVTQKNES